MMIVSTRRAYGQQPKFWRRWALCMWLRRAYSRLLWAGALPRESDGHIEPRTMTVRGQEWQVYAVGGSPAQAFLHGYYEVLGFKPDLVVSGIN